ncbi:MAG TPA: SDR family NAD(P)-dependent oxidoreductase [Puia sp.]|nr:SDR family NAD(P)-dependent oxidoreductase [Puia sp.]
MKDRIAVISGASSGIGRSVACRLAEQGVRLVLNARTEEKLTEAAQEARSLAGADNIRTVCGDISQDQVTVSCIDECYKTWQRKPDIFIASAGRGLPGTVVTSNPDEWDDLIDINIKGLMHQLRNIARTMMEQAASGFDFVSNPMDIVVIGSTIGRNISPFNSVYGATKFAAHGLTEALRRQLGPLGIRVTLIEPGLVGTNFQRSAGYSETWFEEYSKEVGPILKPDDIARVISFLLSLPGNINLDNISIRPTRQAYP